MGNNLRSERTRLGMTQASLAKCLGVDESTVRDWELGKRPIPSSKVLKSASIFRCSTDYLLGLTDERLPLAALRR